MLRKPPVPAARRTAGPIPTLLGSGIGGALFAVLALIAGLGWCAAFLGYGLGATAIFAGLAAAFARCRRRPPGRRARLAPERIRAMAE